MLNDDLSSSKITERDIQLRQTLKKYGLNPSILGTCHQIYEEASSILYGRNTFIIDCLFDTLAQTPINRYLYNRNDQWDGRLIEAKYSAAFNKIKHWKVLLSACKEDSVFTAPNPHFLMFCRRLTYGASPQSITVLIVPKGDMFHYHRGIVTGQHLANLPGLLNQLNAVAQGLAHPIYTYHEMSDVLKPLSLLRHLPVLRIGEAEGDDLPIFDPNADMSQVTSHQILPSLKDSIMATLQTRVLSSPLVFKMYENLVTYARAFERNKVFKLKMESPYRSAKARRAGVRNFRLDQERGNPFRIEMYRSRNDDAFKSHPVEAALEAASIASEDNDLSPFKVARKLVIEFLEPQYRRIVDASLQLNVLVKNKKREGSMFEAGCDYNSSVPASFRYARGRSHIGFDDSDLWALEIFGSPVDLVIRLENYAKSFTRDLTPQVERYIRVRKRQFELSYSTLPREALLRELDAEMEAFNSMPTDNLIEIFKRAVDDMDKQYLEIRRARKALFDHDMGDWGVELDLELWRCDEMVDWTVNEPKIGVGPRPRTEP